MKVGMIGCGKLGLPVMLAMEHRGHDVMGHDVDPARMTKEDFPHREVGPNGEPDIRNLLRGSNLTFGTLAEIVAHSEIIFVAVQTPHDARYAGDTLLPSTRKDFDYTHLRESVALLNSELIRQQKTLPVLVISTVLPGTIRREIKPLISEAHFRLCYNPFFIAMGTTIADFLNPEFVLFGQDDPWALEVGRAFYATITDAPIAAMSIESAEATKVAYNSIITAKIVLANLWMEICHKTPGANVDEVQDALALATRRIVSTLYTRGGMGDGGGCHPRDNIALSWLAERLRLSCDPFDDLMHSRQQQTIWLADLMTSYGDQPLVILGKSFKPETDLTVGSPAVLLARILEHRGHTVQTYDPHVDRGMIPLFMTGVYLIGTKHKCWQSFLFPAGSIVIDPWRYLDLSAQNVTYVPVGVGT